MLISFFSWMWSVLLVTGGATAAVKSITLDTGDVFTIYWGA